MNTKSGLFKLAKAGGIIAIIAIAFLAGSMVNRPPAQPEHSMPQTAPADAAETSGTIWTCAMHPQIRLPHPGKCPICGMDLIPVVSAAAGGDWELTLSEADERRAHIETAVVERKFVDAQIRLVGKIAYDETRLKTISAWVPGRIDRLFVDYTGVTVSKGDHMVQLYSPELLTAQEELLEAKRRAGESVSERSEFLRASTQRTLESAREKLRLWGLSEAQIREIENRGTAENTVVIESPLDGVVIHKEVNQGQYVEMGSPIYHIADLSNVWVFLQAYETDLPWLHFGQRVEVTTEAYPGELFEGIIALVHPVLDEATRTVQVRLNVKNPEGRLRPGMFVRATVHSRVATEGKVMDPDLAGKWISPMHPEIVRDQAGNCPICGMALVRAEDLGYVSADDERAKPLVVPVAAVLRTGKRGVVYVETLVDGMRKYEGREIVLGTRAGDYYVVLSGLDEGERVVVNGNFVIDSELQLRAKPSMMSLQGGEDHERHTKARFAKPLEGVYAAYLNAQTHLADQQFDFAAEAVAALRQTAASVDASSFDAPSLAAWNDAAAKISDAASGVTAASEPAALRAAFGEISEAILALERAIGHTGGRDYVEVFCPMAFDTGASWLQLGAEVRNPFMDPNMRTCGTVKARHAALELPIQAPAAAAGGSGGHVH